MIEEVVIMRVRRARTNLRRVRRILLAPLAAVVLLAGLLPAVAPPAQAAPLLGHDISWPQCPSSVGGFDLPSQKQGEAIAVDQDNRVYVSSEGARAPVLEVALPRQLARVVAGETDATPQADEPEPDDEPTTQSRDGQELPASEGVARRDPVPWLIGSGLMVVMVLVLIRSLRPTEKNPPR